MIGEWGRDGSYIDIFRLRVTLWYGNLTVSPPI